MKNNKKGFTLIELLAVIVVLAIIMVIATGQVTDTINNSRKSSFTSSYKMIEKEFKRKMAENELMSGTNEYICDASNECSTMYDISAADYSLTVKKDLNACIKDGVVKTWGVADGTTCSEGSLEADYGYTIELSGVTNGKFENVNYTSGDKDCPVSGNVSGAANSCSGNIIIAHYNADGIMIK